MSGRRCMRPPTPRARAGAAARSARVGKACAASPPGDAGSSQVGTDDSSSLGQFERDAPRCLRCPIALPAPLRQRFLFARCLELRLLRVPGAAIFVFAVAGLRPHVVGMLSTSCGSSGSVVLIWAARVATRGKRVSERSNRASHGPRPHRAAERPSLSSSSLLLQSLLWASKAAALRLAERCPATWASPPALPAAARAMSGCSAARWGRSSVLQQAAQELEVEAVAVLCPAPDVVRGALRRRELDRRLDRQLCNHERASIFVNFHSESASIFDSQIDLRF